MTERSLRFPLSRKLTQWLKARCRFVLFPSFQLGRSPRFLCFHDFSVKQDYRFFKSLQQTMLSRPLTEYAVTSSEARRLLLYMATSKAPDELYFPTLTQLDERFSSM